MCQSFRRKTIMVHVLTLMSSWVGFHLKSQVGLDVKPKFFGLISQTLPLTEVHVRSQGAILSFQTKLR